MERISGNNGTDEKYIVVAKNGNVALGLYLKAHRDFDRDEISGCYPFTITGRFRAAAAPGCEATAEEINDAFKPLPFEKFAAESGSLAVRASCTVSYQTNQILRATVVEALDNVKIGSKILEWLAQYISPGCIVMTGPQLHTAVTDEIAKKVGAKDGHMDAVKYIADTDTDSNVAANVLQIDDQHAEDHQLAREVFDAAIAKADFLRDEAAKLLTEKYREAHPEFIFTAAETNGEFNLASLLEGEGVDEESEYDDDPAYDA
jgi:hypothetical protein